MAVVSNVAVINLLSDNGLLAPSYSKEKALSDLSSSLIGTRTFDDEDINETIKLLPTMTSAKIKNASDLNAVVSLNKDEIIERSELYKSYDETLSLGAPKDLATDPRFLIAKLEYCKKTDYPYCDDTGRIYEEVSQDSLKSLGFLERFYTLYHKKYDMSKPNEYNHIIEGAEDDRISNIFSKIQNSSLMLFNKFVNIPKEFEKGIEQILANDELSIKDILFLSFSSLKQANPFIDAERIQSTFMQHDAREEFRRNGQR